MGVTWGSTHAERRSLSRRSTSTGVVPGAPSQRGFLSRCQAAVLGRSADAEHGCPASYSDALAALERVHRRIAA